MITRLPKGVLVTSLILIATFVLSLCFGSVHIDLFRVVAVFLNNMGLFFHYNIFQSNDVEQQIIMNIRLPRVLLGTFVGASLGLAGTSFQAITRNELADPYTLGVSAGASVGAFFVIAAGLTNHLLGFTIPLGAFFTGVLTLGGVLYLVRGKTSHSRSPLILAGVVMHTFCSAIVLFFLSKSQKMMNEMTFWMMGSVAFRGWLYVIVLFCICTVGFVFLCAQARYLDVLALGDEEAMYVGVNVGQLKLRILFVATVLTAAAVAAAGVVGFVGLIVPHVARRFVGPNYRNIIPLAMLGGAILTLWADVICRTALAPTEIPLGVVTAFVGAPFFAYVLKYCTEESEL